MAHNSDYQVSRNHSNSSIHQFVSASKSRLTRVGLELAKEDILTCRFSNRLLAAV